MERRTIALLSAATLLLSSAGIGLADEGNDLVTAFTSGKTGVNIRSRYEHVDQADFTENANALTARLRLNYRTGQWNSLTGFVEYDYLFHLFNDFNSGAGTSPDKGQFPVVADPKGADLNQLYLDYNFSEDRKLRFGRQRISLDNERFVGGVGWRQNEQTFDALTYTTAAISNTDLMYSYIGTVRRIFGAGVDAGSHNVDTHLLHARVTLNDNWSVTPYYYHIENKDVAAFSTATAGARLAGEVSVGKGKAALIVELATQKDVANNPVNYDAQYVHLSGLWTFSNGLSMGLAYESLGTDTASLQSFRTPLATLHAFQGWADKFLTTPARGINDVYLTAKYKINQWKLTGVYHDFSSAAGGTDYGTEFDVSAGRKLTENVGILFKGAFFSGDTAAYPDTNKFWIMFTANY